MKIYQIGLEAGVSFSFLLCNELSAEKEKTPEKVSDDRETNGH